jgi:hypothetical protein
MFRAVLASSVIAILTGCSIASKSLRAKNSAGCTKAGVDLVEVFADCENEWIYVAGHQQEDGEYVPDHWKSKKHGMIPMNAIIRLHNDRPPEIWVVPPSTWRAGKKIEPDGRWEEVQSSHFHGKY